MATFEEIETAMRRGHWTEGARPTDAKLHAYEGVCRFRLGDFASPEPCPSRANGSSSGPATPP